MKIDLTCGHNAPPATGKLSVVGPRERNVERVLAPNEDRSFYIEEKRIAKLHAAKCYVQDPKPASGKRLQMFHMK